MATRRRRPTATTPAPEPTHEEMLEIAEEREEVAMASGVADTFEAAMAEAEKEEIEEFLAVTVADTFEALQAAEEEKGVDNFFDPGFYVAPKPVVPQARPTKRPRYIPRTNARRRKG